MNVQEILARVRQFGAELIVIDGKLKAAPAGVLPLELKTVICDRATEIKAQLRVAEYCLAAKAPETERNRWPERPRSPMPLRKCSCGAPWFWLSPFGAIKCCACDPPADLSLAEGWVLAREDEGCRIPPEILAMLHVKQRVQ